MEPGDEDLTFLMPTHHDAYRAENALVTIREHYPTARVILFADRDESQMLSCLATYANAELFHLQDDLFPADRCAAFHRPQFEQFLLRPSRWFIKIDTDAIVRRRIKELPDETVCCVWTIYEDRFPQGGAYALTEAALRKLWRLGPQADLPEWVYHRRREMVLRRGKVIAEDRLIGHLCQLAGVPLLSSDEFACCGHPKWVDSNFRQRMEQAAMCHPVSRFRRRFPC